MLLSSLRLESFRSYAKRAFQFSSGISVIVGPNTSGKTNILEALVLLSTGKSFRADKDSEMIYRGCEFGKVHGELVDESLEILITTGLVQGVRVMPKKFFSNGVARRMVDFAGILKTVLFWPEHLELVTGSPSLRRRFLDTVLCQVDREYRRNLNSYERGIRQRNKLLFLIHEGKANRSQLLFWDQLVIKAGNYLTQSREAFITFLNAFRVQNAIFQLHYDTSIISESRIASYAEAEVASKVTLVGPHRDDIIFQKQMDEDWVDLGKYGSRGEQRLGVLWAKLGELSFITSKTGDRPLLLLDDIFSEFDPEHQSLVSNIVKEQQTIITSANPEDVARALVGVQGVEKIVLERLDT